MDVKLAEILKKNGFVDRDLLAIERSVKEQGLSLMYAVENTRKLPKQRAVELVAEYLRVPYIDLAAKTLAPVSIGLITSKLAETYRVIPIERSGNAIVVATGNPKNLRIADEVQFTTGSFAKLVLASEHDISAALQKYYVSRTQVAWDSGPGKKKKSAQGVGDEGRMAIKTRRTAYDNEVVKLVDNVIVKCYQRGASDLHIEPYDNYVRVRIRIDGVLTEIARVDSELKTSLIARIKVICGMDVSETRLPQDANLGVLIDNVPIDFRVSTLPTVYGEKVVMRLLDKSALRHDMRDLGFERSELTIFRTAIQRPWGLVLVTGPTGSGKTTTLYSALSDRNQAEENILTIEDPVEYNLEGINQVQTKDKIEFTFARALRSFLRQDPDVIMLGEIRDAETADIAVKAALTGHMVLSTLHTNNSYETIVRMINMGVESYNLIGSLLCIVAQRLMRRLCQECRFIDDVPSEYLIKLGIREKYTEQVKIYKARGCKACDGLGTKGRVAIYEVLQMTDDLRDAVVRDASAMELKKIAIRSGLRTLRQSALIKMTQGLVSATEVTSITNPDTE